VSRAFAALMPVSHSLAEVVAAHIASDRDAVEPLAGQPQLLAIALNNRDLALRAKALLDACEEGDFEGALHVLDHVSLKLRELCIDARADEAGIVNRK
jgi:hypothetical protein